MKNIFIAAFGGMMFAVACNNGSNDSVKVADSANSAKTDSQQKQQSVTDSTGVPSKQDADFMVGAASGGMLEVELGQLAQAQGGSKAVKDFGAMMVRDHGKGGDEIKSLAVAKRIVLPDSVSNAQKKERDDLRKKSGRTFDKAYIDLMVEDHKEDISDFQKASGNANDPDIKAFASNHLAMLRMHLDSAQAIQQRVKKM